MSGIVTRGALALATIVGVATVASAADSRDHDVRHAPARFERDFQALAPAPDAAAPGVVPAPEAFSDPYDHRLGYFRNF